MKQKNRLQGAYAQQYHRLRRRLCWQAEPSETRQQILDTLAAMLAQAQQQGLPPETVYGGDFEDFYAALLSQLPNLRTAKQQAVALLRQAALWLLLILGALALCAGIYLKQTGAIAVWRQGFPALARFRQPEIQVVEGSFELTLDLQRPEENFGQPLYRDQGCSITVAGVYLQPDGAIGVTLRCKGEYGLKKGRLVSFSAFDKQDARPSTVELQAQWGEYSFGGYALPGAGLDRTGCQAVLLLLPPDRPADEQENILRLQLKGLVQTTWS